MADTIEEGQKPRLEYIPQKGEEYTIKKERNYRIGSKEDFQYRVKFTDSKGCDRSIPRRPTIPTDNEILDLAERYGAGLYRVYDSFTNEMIKELWITEVDG